MSSEVCVALIQSPSTHEMLADGIGENPHLTDNWDDAEGYYRMSSYNMSALETLSLSLSLSCLS